MLSNKSRLAFKVSLYRLQNAVIVICVHAHGIALPIKKLIFAVSVADLRCAENRSHLLRSCPPMSISMRR